MKEINEIPHLINLLVCLAPQQFCWNLDTISRYTHRERDRGKYDPLSRVKGSEKRTFKDLDMVGQ